MKLSVTAWSFPALTLPCRSLSGSVDRNHDQKPRIQRSIADLEPMDVVVMDVHHINVLIERETGKTATAKMIAFLDIATSRLFVEIIMFEGKGGVRNSDIITAFINMCMDKNFGLPKVLYVDNGSEYGWADHLQDALKLNIRINGFDWQSGRNPVVRATPYNASPVRLFQWIRSFGGNAWSGHSRPANFAMCRMCMSWTSRRLTTTSS